MPALLINNEIYGDTPFDKQQKIINVINQASKTWVMPTDIQITHYGVGEVGNKEFSDIGEYYLDVVSGNVYVSDTVIGEEITTPGGDIVGEKITYMWELDRTLVSVQDALEWKFVGSATGKNAISLPENFRELQIDMNTSGTVHFSFYIIKEMLTASSVLFRQGYYDSEQYYCHASVYASTKTAVIEHARQNGTDLSTSATIKVWYR